MVDLRKRNPTIQLLLKKLEKELGHGVLEVHSLRNSPNVVVLSTSGSSGTRISVAAQPRGCYSIQVRVPDDSVPLMGIDIPVDASKMPLGQTVEILSKYLRPRI
jgi:hypothetical protein